ncbi:hypothetical protein B0H10DRAFT_685020 [Mycena sp. CBHHK59/15]|nr:hypothetical protein B0H10DRAFT_685020 [Mycena sp. CBHHK59/15]
MDDPWANAWGEPATTSKLPPPVVFAAKDDVDDEEDITIPSWEAPVSWADQNSLWGARSPALDKFPSWQPEPSPYDDIPLGQPLPSPPAAFDLPLPHTPPDDDEHVAEPEPEPPFQPPISPPISPPLSPPLPRSLSPPRSPDVFGTFETGLDDARNTDPWSPTPSSFAPDSADSNAWGAAWAPANVEQHPEDDVPAVVDEWEAAKQKKAMQDTHVPPELLASILLQFTELADELYPSPPASTSDPDDYRANRHKGLQGVDTLNSTITRLLPTDPTLPPLRPFPKSATAKHTADALRLSRSAAFVRFSPLGHYSATKGSTAWEASVKSRPEPISDADLLPPGWRVVGSAEAKAKEDAAAAAAAEKKKSGHGGLLSFFGRRTGTPPVVAGSNGARDRSASVSSPRASIDSVKSPTSTTKSPTISTAPSTSGASPTASSSVPPPPPTLPAVSHPQPDVGAGAGADPEPAVPAAPSAVSRFLGRFGRKAPAAAEQQGLALSEGDFDFLSDIEGGAAGAGPSTGAGADTHFSMSGVLLDAPVPLPAKLAPPPRAPVVPVSAPSRNGQTARPDCDADSDDLAVFGTYTPPPPVKAPPLGHSQSTPTPAPMVMPPADTDIDFSAWGFDEEEKPSGVVRTGSEPVSAIGGAWPSRRAVAQPLNARVATNAKGAIPPPRRAPTAIMSSGPSKPPAVVPKLDVAFSFPPPPRTQTQTPVAGVLPPPPSAPKANANATLFDDDDDFSDFHSPTLSPPSSTVNSFYDNSFSSSTSSDRGLFSVTSSTSIPANMFDDFDDFMQASPHSPITLRTPSPPRPPAKPTGVMLNAPPAAAPPATPSPVHPQDLDDTPLALIAHTSNSSLLSKRTATRAAHQRTLSLVETAAARSGVRWPAPPSPLPDLLPPPDGGDPFGFGASMMQSQQATWLGSEAPALKAFPPPPAATVPSRALSPPLPSAQSQRALSPGLPLPPQGGGQKAATRVPVLAPPPMLTAQRQKAGILDLPTSPPLPSAAPKQGGLSAQDLSFFEGL